MLFDSLESVELTEELSLEQYHCCLLLCMGRLWPLALVVLELLLLVSLDNELLEEHPRWCLLLVYHLEAAVWCTHSPHSGDCEEESDGFSTLELVLWALCW